VPRRLSYANVAATLALVFAMSGGAIAAKHYLISSTTQISPKVLKKLKGRTGKQGPAGREGTPGREGPAGKAGANGERGPSAAFDVKKPEEVNFPETPEFVTVASRSLPAGSYAVTGKVIVNNDSTEEGAEVVCALKLGSNVIDEGGIMRMTKELAGADRAMVVDSGVGTLASAGTARLDCKVEETHGTYLDAAITAVQVGSIG
jgi:hypothetical protein